MTHPLHWIAAWLILDFTMYWRHRAAHRIAFLWAVHSVHHQSEEYNTTVGARASMFQDTILVVMPLAILGAPVSMAMTIFAFISFVTFFSHTELVGTLGVLDKVFVTPSVHRVHHGRNTACLDTNYGASLVIWDRIFGTYAEETEKVEYGTLDGLDSYDPLANNLNPWQKLIFAISQTNRALVTL
jgi:sterol desaturase/sphingolipid hydroxylase (fatty acid hydroxylase superfamily)